MRIFISLFFVLSLGGCAVEKTPQPSGSNRSDDIVKLSYKQSFLEIPVIDHGKALAQARIHCQKRGYKDALPFEGVKRKCIDGRQHNCDTYLVTIRYQCTT